MTRNNPGCVDPGLSEAECSSEAELVFLITNETSEWDSGLRFWEKEKNNLRTGFGFGLNEIKINLQAGLEAKRQG